MFSKKQPISSENTSDFNDSLEDTFAVPDLADSDHHDAAPVQDGINSVAARPTKPSIISEGFEFVGNITSEGTLNIAGVVKGKISAKSVLVDVEGCVEGELSSEMLVVKGKVIGEVVCQELNVGPRAFIDGNISYQHIHIQRGGKVAGKFNKN
ncbi:MAG: polymer-forming cytoskeletal protein [Polynucleobacter sp.]|nr:polymer-forming cytoskeletal protein [Polynucleobacter sp.]MDZ4056641.1 polymer-forming cytoskeletal protein [Polynucleobacter sp.]